jgi:hypothetical protein
MMWKALRVLAAAGVGLLVASSWQDIVRYWKIRQLSAGSGHPANVPAPGRIAYPQQQGGGKADGTAEFDSASRGGPALPA